MCAKSLLERSSRTVKQYHSNEVKRLRFCHHSRTEQGRERGLTLHNNLLHFLFQEWLERFLPFYTLSISIPWFFICCLGSRTIFSQLPMMIHWKEQTMVKAKLGAYSLIVEVLKKLSIPQESSRQRQFKPMRKHARSR